MDFSKIEKQGVQEDPSRIHDPYMAQVFSLAGFFLQSLSDYTSASSYVFPIRLSLDPLTEGANAAKSPNSASGRDLRRGSHRSAEITV